MPITLQDIKTHKDQYGLHDFLRSTLSEEILTTNREQLETLIEYLQSISDKMSS